MKMKNHIKDFMEYFKNFRDTGNSIIGLSLISSQCNIESMNYEELEEFEYYWRKLSFYAYNPTLFNLSSKIYNKINKTKQKLNKNICQK